MAVDNYTEPEAEKIFELICTKLFPTPIRAECSSFIAQYGKIIISLLVNGVDPAKVCRTIGQCPKTKITQVIKPIPVPEPEVVIDTPEKTSSFECSLCVYVGEFVKDLLKSNKTDTQVVKELELVCNAFPTALSQQVKTKPYFI